MISRKSGGMSSALDLSESLYLLGYDLHIILTGSSPLLYQIKDKIKTRTIIPLSNIHTLPTKYKKYFERNYSFNFLDLSVEKSKSNGRNLFVEIFGNTFVRGVNSLSSLLSLNKSLKVIQKSDVIINCSGFFYGAKEALLSLTNAKIILNHPGSVSSYENWWLTNQNRPRKYNNNLSEYINFVSQFDYILFQAKDQALECEAQSYYLKGKTIVVKPSCEEQIVLAAKQLSSPFDEDNFHIVSVGSIQARKGQHYAIKALAKVLKNYTKVKLHFVGGGLKGEYYNELLDLINTLKLNEKVCFHGHRSDYLSFMAHANIVLQTSEAEGVSRILRETMLLGTPIVSFAIPGTLDILTDEEDSILVQPFDINMLADAILMLLNNKELYIQISRKSRERYYLNHSKAAYYNNLITVINKITEHRL